MIAVLLLAAVMAGAPRQPVKKVRADWLCRISPFFCNENPRATTSTVPPRKVGP